MFVCLFFCMGDIYGCLKCVYFLFVCTWILIWVSPFRKVFNLLPRAETGISSWVIFHLHLYPGYKKAVTRQGEDTMLGCRKQYKESWNTSRCISRRLSTLWRHLPVSTNTVCFTYLGIIFVKVCNSQHLCHLQCFIYILTEVPCCISTGWNQSNLLMSGIKKSEGYNPGVSTVYSELDIMHLKACFPLKWKKLSTTLKNFFFFFFKMQSEIAQMVKSLL